jgi:hypothetical protein
MSGREGGNACNLQEAYGRAAAHLAVSGDSRASSARGRGGARRGFDNDGGDAGRFS